MLQLGKKYHIDTLRQDAIRRLAEYFPSELDSFRNAYTDENVSYLDGFVGDALDIRPRNAIAVVVLAQQCNVPRFLPPAFYLCAQLEMDEILCGYTDEDGSHWELSKEDMKRCLLGQQALRLNSQKRDRFVLEAKHCLTCNTRNTQRCTTVLESYRKYWWDTGGDDSRALYQSSWIANLGLCNSCLRHFSSKHDAVIKETWGDLAHCFDLEVKWPIPYEEIVG